MKKLFRPIILRAKLLRASFVYTFRLEMAYFWNGWANIFSTVAYVLIYLVLINVIFRATDSIAGYSENEMYFFFVMTQLMFYTSFAVFPNLLKINQDINTGSLDLLLTKPIPELFYLTFRKIPFVQVLRDGLAPSIVAIAAVDWYALSFNTFEIICALVIAACGFVSFNAFIVLLTIPTFWLGENQSMIDLGIGVLDGAGLRIPIDAWNSGFKILFTLILPVGISAGLSSSVALGKLDAISVTLYALGIAIFLSFVKEYFWNIGIRNYTSASS